MCCSWSSLLVRGAKSLFYAVDCVLLSPTEQELVKSTALAVKYEQCVSDSSPHVSEEQVVSHV